MSTRLVQLFYVLTEFGQTKSTCFTIDRLNPDAITPLQAIRTFPFSRTTARTPKNILIHAFFLLMRSHAYALSCDFQCMHGLLPEDGLLRFYLEPARTSLYCGIIGGY